MCIVILLNLCLYIWLKIRHIEEISGGVQTPWTPTDTVLSDHLTVLSLTLTTNPVSTITLLLISKI